MTRTAGQVTVTFDGARGNALGRDRYAALQAAAEDTGPEELLLINAAGKHFCAGQDLVEHQQAAAAGRSAEALRQGTDAVLALLRCRGTVVVAAQGAAIGGGALLVAAADMVVLADDAWLRLPELRLGLPLGLAVAERLLPAPVVRRMMLTGVTATADQLREVAAVVPREELEQATSRIIDGVRAIDPEVRETARRLWGDDERERTAQAYQREVDACVRLLGR